MAVAYSAAQLAVLDACADGDGELDAHAAVELLAGIAAALCWGPPGLATDQRLQAAAAKCFELVLQVGRTAKGSMWVRLCLSRRNASWYVEQHAGELHCRPVDPLAVTCMAGLSTRMLTSFSLLLQADILECSGSLQVFQLASRSPRTAAVLLAEDLLEKMVWAVLDRLVPTEQATAGDLSVLLYGVFFLPTVHQLLTAAEGVAQQSQACGESEAAAAAAVGEAAAALKRAMHGSRSLPLGPLMHAAVPWLPLFRRLAAALLAWWRRPEERQAAALLLAQAAAARSCAYLCCANLGGEGGPAAGQGAGSQRCRWAAVRGVGGQCMGVGR